MFQIEELSYLIFVLYAMEFCEKYLMFPISELNEIFCTPLVYLTSYDILY